SIDVPRAGRRAPARLSTSADNSSGLTHTNSSPTNPGWFILSPDGQWVGFWLDTKLMKTPIGGGLPVAICDVPRGSLFGVNWRAGDRIVYSMNGEGISMVPATGGTPTSLTKADPRKSEALHILPHVLPGGKTILYTVVASFGDWEHTSVIAQSLK